MLRRTVNFLADIAALLFLAAVVLFLHRDLAFTDAILGDYDLVAYFYPYRTFAIEALREGRLPLWNPLIFGGAPFLANIQSAVYYPPNWLGLWLDAPKLLGLSLLAHYWLAGAGMFLFCRSSLALNRTAAILGGMAYMLSGFLAAQAGHPNQVGAAAWLPVIFLCFDVAVARGSMPVAAIGGLAVAMQVLSGHPQESYYSAVGLGLFAAFRIFSPRLPRDIVDAPPVEGASRYRRMRTGAMRLLGRTAVIGLMSVIMAGLGAGIAAAQLLPSWQLTRYSIRSSGLHFDLATIFSLPPWDVLRALLPAFRDYAFGEHIAYLGVVPVVLAVFALVFRRDHPLTSFLGGMATLSLVLALGRYTPIYQVAFDYVPGVGSFRVPARWLLLFIFSVSLLGAIGLSSMALPRSVRPWLQARRRSYVISAVIVGVLAAGIAGAYWAAVSQSTLPAPDVLARWAGLSLLGGAVAGLGMWLAPSRGLALVLVFLALAELGLARQGLGYLRVFPPHIVQSLRPAQTAVLETGPGRVLSLAGTDFPPGDLPELKAELERYLVDDPDGLRYALSLINLKEAMSPNINVMIGVPSLDGYDGGMLPLDSFFTIRGILRDSAAQRSAPTLVREASTPDRLLRLELPGMPDARMLAGLGVRYIIAGKTGDAWPDGVYYDMAVARQVWRGMNLTLRDLPEFETTSVGLMTFFDGDESLADGTPIARVTVSDNSGAVVEREIRVGRDTAFGRNTGEEHTHPAVVAPWWNTAVEGNTYLTQVPLGSARYLHTIQVEALTDKATLYVQGLSIVDERLGASMSITIDPDLELIHVGDLKVYRNRHWVGPLYVAGTAIENPDPPEGVRDLSRVAPNAVVLHAGPSAASRVPAAQLPPVAPRNSGARSRALAFERPVPELVRADVEVAEPSFVVFAEAFYRGWEATVDGQLVEILPANGFFQAIAVPAGKHKVEFRYRSGPAEIGLGITQVSLIFMMVLVVVPVVAGPFVRRFGRWRRGEG